MFASLTLAYIFGLCLSRTAAQLYKYNNPIIAVTVTELSSDYINVNVLVTSYGPPPGNITKQLEIVFRAVNVAISLTTRTVPLIRENNFLDRAKTNFSVPLLGIAYEVRAIVPEYLNSWQLSTIHRAAPLPPEKFDADVEGSVPVFEFTTPAHTTAANNPSVYNYLKFTCTNGYLSAGEKMEHISENLTTLTNLLRTRDKLPLRIIGEVDSDSVKVYKDGGYINCTLVAVSDIGIVIESKPKQSDFIIAPTAPELRWTFLPDIGSSAILYVTINLTKSTFSNIKIESSSTVLCSLARSAFTSDTAQCQVDFQTSGTRYSITSKIWSAGPVGRMKMASETTTVVVPPPSPPTNFSFVEERGRIITFTWEYNKSEEVEQFVLTVCKRSNHSSTCLDETFLNISESNSRLELVKQLDVGKTYIAWVQAVYRGVRSTRSNIVTITKQSLMTTTDAEAGRNVTNSITPETDSTTTLSFITILAGLVAVFLITAALVVIKLQKKIVEPTDEMSGKLTGSLSTAEQPNSVEKMYKKEGSTNLHTTEN